MKIMKSLMALCSLLLLITACTKGSSDANELNQPDTWVLSRSTDSSIESMLMVGKHKSDQNKDFYKKLTFNGTKGEWVNGSPDWQEGDIYDLIALSPATDDLPENDIIDASVPYQIQYWADCIKGDGKENRPTTFLLKHLLGQLVVHVTIHELSSEDHEPKDMQIMFHEEGKIDYAAENITAVGERKWMKLKGFVHEKIDEDAEPVEPDEAGEIDHKWVMEQFVYIIPQTLPANKLAVTFYVDDPIYGKAQYEFLPDEELVFEAGKVTHLYLGVVYEHDDEPTYTLVDFSVKVTDWVEDDAPTSGTATPQ